MLKKRRLNRHYILILVAATLLGPAVYSLTRPNSEKQALTLVSDAYRLDKIYRSMEGPMSVQRGIHLADAEKRQVQWITGIDAQVVDASQEKPVSPEFFCHANLTFAEKGATPNQYNKQFGGKTHLDWRLFTLAPGRPSIELPPGFGVPIPPNASLDYLTMSLNLNARDHEIDVRMKTNVHTIAADQPGAPTKAVFRRALYVLQPRSESTHLACAANERTQHVGAGCAEFSTVSLPGGSNAGGKTGEGLVNHWIVSPGHHVYKTEITPQMHLPFDTTIHYATIHVHPFAKGMELHDLTTGTTIFRLNSEDFPDRLGVAHVGEVKSIDGIPISRDHRYELTAEYDNTSGSNTDAMAILYLYLLEKDLG